MKKITLLLLIILPNLLFAQVEKTSTLKEISGVVTTFNEPIKGISVQVKNTERSTETDAKGFYKILAKEGETVEFDFYRLEKVSILVEDVTFTLHIKMVDTYEFTESNEDKINRFREETIGLNSIKFSAVKIDPNTLNKNSFSITDAILEKVDFLKVKPNKYNEQILYVKGRELNGPVSWEIDNSEFDFPYPIKISEIKNILILSYNNNCSIKIQTNINYRKRKDIIFNNYYFTDDDFYAEDAVRLKKIKTEIPTYLNTFKKISNSKKALVAYNEVYESLKNKPNFHVNTYNYFQKKYRKSTILLKLLADFELFADSNPEDLKLIAFKYQELKENVKAIKTYKRILEIRPNYSQSYRDLANAFLSVKDYSNAWKVYKYYYTKGFKIENNDIGSILYSEMVSAYNGDSNIKNIENKLSLAEPSKNTNKDIRIVFEWNTTEAEFELEFVNPDYEVYTLENSLIHNDALILDQKTKGYTSKEIYIDTVIEGNWLVNFTYFGNKKDSPTSLKVTTYYNWGRKNQKQKVKTYDFTETNVKVQLLKI